MANIHHAPGPSLCVERMSNLVIGDGPPVDNFGFPVVVHQYVMHAASSLQLTKLVQGSPDNMTPDRLTIAL